MTDKDNHTQEGPDVSIPSTVILETHYEYDSTIFFSDSALEAIQKYNDGKTVDSQNSPSKKLLIDRQECAETIDWNYIRIHNRFSMPPLCLFHLPSRRESDNG